MFNSGVQLRSRWMAVVVFLIGTGILWMLAALVIYSELTTNEAPTPPPTTFLDRTDCTENFEACLSDITIPDTTDPPTTAYPTQKPTPFPTKSPLPPTPFPTNYPTNYPTFKPTVLQTERPTLTPTPFPTEPVPTTAPTAATPTAAPTTTTPTAAPTNAPTNAPTHLDLSSFDSTAYGAMTTDYHNYELQTGVIAKTFDYMNNDFKCLGDTESEESEGSWCKNTNNTNNYEYVSQQFFHHYYANDDRTRIPAVFLIHGGGFKELGRMAMGYTKSLVVKLLSWGFQVFELDYPVMLTTVSPSSFLGLFFKASDKNNNPDDLPNTHHSQMDWVYFNANLCTANNGNSCASCDATVTPPGGCSSTLRTKESCCNGQTHLTTATDIVSATIQDIVDDTSFAFDRNYIGVFGFSVGGFISAEYARRQTAGEDVPRMNFNVLYSGGSFFNDLQFQTFQTKFMGPNSNSNNLGMYPYNPSAFIDITQNYVTDVPFLAVHGQQDTTVPAFFSLSLDPGVVYDAFPTIALDTEFDTYNQVSMLLPNTAHVGNLEMAGTSVYQDWLQNEIECTDGYTIGGSSNRDYWVPPESDGSGGTVLNDFNSYKDKGEASKGCSKFVDLGSAPNSFSTVYDTTRNFVWKFINSL